MTAKVFSLLHSQDMTTEFYENNLELFLALNGGSGMKELVCHVNAAQRE